MGERAKADKVLDVRGWSGQWSILKAKSELKRMQPGQVLEVLGTDHLILKDFPAILSETDDEVLRVDQDSDFFRMYLRKGNSRAARGLSGSQKDLYEL